MHPALPLLAAFVQLSEGLIYKDGVGKLPSLGWNSWNAYGCDVNADKIVQAANDVVNLGLKDAGYNYINIDDCWSVKSGRDESTNELIPDPAKFPDGISAVADKVHALGLKLGIYGTAGLRTCGGYPASLGYEDIDAKSFASWGVDYLKYDNCNIPSNWTDTYDSCVPDRYKDTKNGTCLDFPNPPPPDYDWSTSKTATRYRTMRDALAKQDRTILMAVCDWGEANVQTWANEMGASYRMSIDIGSYWESLMEILNENSFLSNYNGYGNHADMDMLEIGNGDLTLAEQRSHFAMWALTKSPLIIGTNVSALSTDELSILKNKYLLAFNQDENHEAPAIPYKWGTNPDWTFNASYPAEFWVGDSDQGTFIAMLNTHDEPAEKEIVFTQIPSLTGWRYELVDVWTGKNLGCFQNEYTPLVEAHDVAVVIANPC